VIDKPGKGAFLRHRFWRRALPQRGITQLVCAACSRPEVCVQYHHARGHDRGFECLWPLMPPRAYFPTFKRPLLSNDRYAQWSLSAGQTDTGYNSRKGRINWLRVPVITHACLRGLCARWLAKHDRFPSLSRRRRDFAIVTRGGPRRRPCCR